MKDAHAMTMHRRAWAGLALALFFTLTAPGCASLGLFALKNPKIPKADAKDPAVEILAIWQPAEGPGPNGVPTRGFSGQVCFFTHKQPASARVEGKVRIYLFDDRGTPEQQSKPMHQFDFDPEAWAQHVRPSPLGQAYNVFIPYPRKDLNQATCALRIRFESTAGPTIYSQMAAVVLPGPTQNTSAAEEPSDSPAAAHDHSLRKAAAKIERTLKSERTAKSAHAAPDDPDRRHPLDDESEATTRRQGAEIENAMAADVNRQGSAPSAESVRAGRPIRIKLCAATSDAPERNDQNPAEESPFPDPPRGDRSRHDQPRRHPLAE